MCSACYRTSLILATLLVVGCGDDSTGAPECPNGVLEEGEECDTTQFMEGATCESLADQGGDLACGGDCRFDKSGCQAPPECGLEVIKLTEAAWRSAERGEPVSVKDFEAVPEAAEAAEVRLRRRRRHAGPHIHPAGRR